MLPEPSSLPVTQRWCLLAANLKVILFCTGFILHFPAWYLYTTTAATYREGGGFFNFREFRAVFSLY